MMGVPTPTHPEDLDVSDATFHCPDLTTFCRLDELGLVVVGQRLAHEPCRGRPTTLLVRVRRYRCATCRRVWRQDTTAAAEPRAKLSRAAVRWALVGLVAQHLTIARIAEALDLSWDTANDAVLAEGCRLLIDDPPGSTTLAGLLQWGHRDPFDPMMAAPAMLESLTLVTSDARLLALEGLHTLAWGRGSAHPLRHRGAVAADGALDRRAVEGERGRGRPQVPVR